MPDLPWGLITVLAAGAVGAASLVSFSGLDALSAFLVVAGIMAIVAAITVSMARVLMSPRGFRGFMREVGAVIRGDIKSLLGPKDRSE